jgi:hypothetical protein
MRHRARLCLRHVPSRFTELLLFALIALGGYGLARAGSRFNTRGKAWFGGAMG